MSPENELAAGLERAAREIDVDVAASFQSGARIARRRRVVRRSMLATAAVVVVVGAVLGGVLAIDSTHDHKAIAPIAPHPSTSGLGHEAYGRIAGTYITTVPSSAIL